MSAHTRAAAHKVPTPHRQPLRVPALHVRAGDYVGGGGRADVHFFCTSEVWWEGVGERVGSGRATGVRRGAGLCAGG